MDRQKRERENDTDVEMLKRLTIALAVSKVQSPSRNSGRERSRSGVAELSIRKMQGCIGSFPIGTCILVSKCVECKAHSEHKVQIISKCQEGEEDQSGRLKCLSPASLPMLSSVSYPTRSQTASAS